MAKGKLTLITGCMFSGKTTNVIILAQKALEERKSIEIYYPEIDTRYTKNYITSHDWIQLPSKALPIDTVSMNIEGKEVIFLDELHFFKDTILKAVDEVVAGGVDVVVSGLDKDFRGDQFPITKELIKKADEVIRLEAKCVVCQKPATFSQRIVGDHFASKDDKTIVVGGEEMYEARCAEHFRKPA